jgi:hypothetical protein
MINKLAKIQQELNAPKNQYNSYGKYNYRSCEDILQGLKPCLKEVGCALTITDELIVIGERYYVKATATLHDIETDKKISNVAYAREEESIKGMTSSQITGSASSYARKYALNGLFCIDDVKDADTTNKQKKTKEQKEAENEQKAIENQLISEIKVNALISKCVNENVPVEKILKLYKIESLELLTERMFRNISDNFEKIKEQE